MRWDHVRATWHLGNCTFSGLHTAKRHFIHAAEYTFYCSVRVICFSKDRQNVARNAALLYATRAALRRAAREMFSGICLRDRQRNSLSYTVALCEKTNYIRHTIIRIPSALQRDGVQSVPISSRYRRDYYHTPRKLEMSASALKNRPTCSPFRVYFRVHCPLVSCILLFVASRFRITRFLQTADEWDSWDQPCV